MMAVQKHPIGEPVFYPPFKEYPMDTRIIISRHKGYTNTPQNHKDNWISKFQKFVCRKWTKHSKMIKRVTVTMTLIGYFIYLGFAIAYNKHGAVALIVLTSLTVGMILYILVRNRYGREVDRLACYPLGCWIDEHWSPIAWLSYPAIIIGILLYLVLVVIRSARQLQSLLGIGVFLFIPLITCKHPNQIRWRPVVWGLFLQFMMGVLVLRWQTGYNAVKFLSEELNTFLSYAFYGAAAVFGDPFFLAHPFAMIVLPLVVFLGSFCAMLYYLGVTQALVNKIGWLMQITLQTTPIESVSLGANIFLSVLDTMLMLKPYINKLTASEFHCFLVGSHATIAGFAFGIFIWFGVSPQHLLTSAVMSAPAAVAISKLNYPETEKSAFNEGEGIQLEKGGEANVIEAGANGAWQAGKSVASITIQVIAFISVYAFADTTVTWMGAKIGIELSLAKIFSYVFRPLAYMMGIDWEDTDTVASLLGLKLVANEMLAFLELGKMRTAKIISERSAALATYAMCGFSSFGTLAIFVGVWSSVLPNKVSEISRQIPRIMLNTNISCFLTACIAGIFYDETEGMDPTSGRASTVIMRALGAIPSYKDLLGLVS